MNRNYAKTFLYADFAKDFTAEFFNATEWAEMFANAGAKWVKINNILFTQKYIEFYRSRDL